MMEKMTYEKAMQKLQSIISELEQDKVNVSDLSDKVQEANQLLAFCRTKLRDTETDVVQLMNDKK